MCKSVILSYEQLNENRKEIDKILKEIENVEMCVSHSKKNVTFNFAIVGMSRESQDITSAAGAYIYILHFCLLQFL